MGTSGGAIGTAVSQDSASAPDGETISSASDFAHRLLSGVPGMSRGSKLYELVRRWMARQIDARDLTPRSGDVIPSVRAVAATLQSQIAGFEAAGLIANGPESGTVRLAEIQPIHVRTYDPTKDAVPTVEECQAILHARGFELGVRAAVWWLRDHATHRPEPTAQRLVDAASDLEGEFLRPAQLTDAGLVRERTRVEVIRGGGARVALSASKALRDAFEQRRPVFIVQWDRELDARQRDGENVTVQLIPVDDLPFQAPGAEEKPAAHAAIESLRAKVEELEGEQNGLTIEAGRWRRAHEVAQARIVELEESLANEGLAYTAAVMDTAEAQVRAERAERALYQPGNSSDTCIALKDWERVELHVRTNDTAARTGTCPYCGHDAHEGRHCTVPVGNPGGIPCECGIRYLAHLLDDPKEHQAAVPADASACARCGGKGYVCRGLGGREPCTRIATAKYLAPSCADPCPTCAGSRPDRARTGAPKEASS